MHLLFLEIDTERIWAAASIGPACIGAYIRSKGHVADMLRVPPEMGIPRIIREIETRSPDLIGISITNRQWIRSRKVAECIRKELNTPVIAGGVFPSFEPETVLSSPGFDYVCIGEGEYAVLELLQHLQSGNILPQTEIQNIQVRGGERPVLRSPVSNLDDLPFMARDMLGESHGVVYVNAGRGCPFSCAFCSAGAFARLYDEPFLRLRSPANIVSELMELKRKQAMNYVIFIDDTFPTQSGWLIEFCEIYGKEIGAGFSIHSRVETVNPEKLAFLANAGCSHVVFGIESGSSRVRKKILGRFMSDQMIKDAFHWVREAGMLVTANVMLGIPGETKTDIEATLSLLQEIRPDDFGFFVYYPYPGTELFDVCRAGGYLPENYSDMAVRHDASILDLPDLLAKDIRTLYARFSDLREQNYFERYGKSFNAQQRKSIRSDFRRMAEQG